MTTGIRITELRLAGASGSDKIYGAQFRQSQGGSFRPLSVIAGPSLTGKTSIIDFIRYCLGDDEHPQHAEILTAVRSALLETELDGQPTVIERAATGSPSRFASIWPSRLAEIDGAAELRISAEPPSDPDGLSQFVLGSFDLSGIELPDSAVNPDTAMQFLSIRDVFRVISLPNDRLDNKNLTFENSPYMVKQKFRQTIDVMFGVHDNEQAVLAARLRLAREAARGAELSANALLRIAEDEHPRGLIQLAADLEEAETAVAALEGELEILDRERRSTEQASQELRAALTAAQDRSRDARVRTRDRRSLIDRLDALRGQYADDKRKMNFLRDAERLFDPLRIVTCPACLNVLQNPPAVEHGTCTLCHQPVATPTQGVETATGRNAILEAELKAVSKRLKSLNDYVGRLEAHLRVLVEESIAADAAADAAAQAVDDITDAPAPWLALRDSLTRRTTEARLTVQAAKAGINAWDRVAEARANHARLVAIARRIHDERREIRQRPDRGAIISALSARFGEILLAIGYPKLNNPFIDDELIPHVRDLPYTSASSGGMVLISLAWNLALWEIAHERDADAPGLLIIDSPQKNLGHNSKDGDSDFADATLVENFYAHVQNWLATDGIGAQLIVVDNSPPASVEENVVVRFTRRADVAPYGLIPEAMS